MALGAVDGATLREDDEASRKQLIRAGEAMVDAGLAIVLNRPGTKIPMCTLTAREAKTANQAAMDAAAAQGDPNAHKRKHACGLAHAITERQIATRVLTRMARHGLFNIGVEPRRSRVLIVDIDTAGQRADFALRSGRDRASLTVASPGQRDRQGNWAHKDGGHTWFEVPEGVELPTAEGIYTAAAGWSAIWGEHQVLVPPSVRKEGAYRLVGGLHPLPDWLLERIVEETQAKQERRTEAARRRAEAGPSKIDDWATEIPWSDILLEDGWTETGLVKNCGCPQWTAPGDHASPESATAHEPGCSVYVCERGHGPLYVWTDHPSEAVAAAVAEYGTRALTKIQVLTHTEGEGRMGRTLRGLGIEDGHEPTIISPHFRTWAQETPRPDRPESAVGASTAGSTASAEKSAPTSSEEIWDDEDDDSEAAENISEAITPEMLFERRVRREVEHEQVRKAALDRIAAADAPPFRTLRFTELLNAPRPEPLISDMLYRDSLARIFGAPGSAKSFLALDLALSIAAGRFWDGTKLTSEPVVYVMAEGQRVNGDRAEAWISKNRVQAEDIDDKFITVPDAVLLTEIAAAPLIALVAEVRPALVVLDTKNAMMIGEENSATDFATLRRVLDQIRKAADCCVVLVDHTGHEGNRARGSSAGTAAMDTEIRVIKDDESKPALVMAEVTRDKAGEAGTEWAWRLVPEHPAAVLEKTDMPTVADAAEDWLRRASTLPTPVQDYDGPGSKAVVDLAQLMIFQTIPRHDRSQLGINLAEARRELKERRGHDPMTVKRAWSALKGLGYIASAYEEPTPVQEQTGAHVWSGPIDPQNGPSGRC